MAEEFRCPASDCNRVMKSKSALTLHIRANHAGDIKKLALLELAKDYGVGAPKPGGGWRTDSPLRAAPSGIPSIDCAIGIGGIPRGCIIEIFGPFSSGKTNVALAFSANAQKHGGMAGYVDAEHRFQASMAQLVPGLDLDTLYYSRPKGGEQALNLTKDYVETGLFDVWTVDSVHGCVPEALVNKKFGEATMSELAKLMSVACQVLEYVVADTNTALIFVNHIKSIPAVTHGKTWFKPGGTALDYYASVQLKVTPIAIYQDSSGRMLGKKIKVRVENSKVAPPYAEAEYDLFLAEGKIKKPNDPYDGLQVVPGVDLGSCWFSVCKELDLIKQAGSKWALTDGGEVLGSGRELSAQLGADPTFSLRRQAEQLVYGQYASHTLSPGAAIESPTVIDLPTVAALEEDIDPDANANLERMLAEMGG